MSNDQKVLRERKQSLNKGHQNVYTMMSTTIIKQPDNNKIRSSSSLPKHYTGPSSGIPITQESILREHTHEGVRTHDKIHLPTNKQKNIGEQLIGWGNLPLNKKTQRSSQYPNNIKITGLQPIKLAKNIIKCSSGQKHIVYINEKYEVYGIGSSVFGQLGYYQPMQNINEQSLLLSNNNAGIPIFEEFSIKEIYCTPYCTFFITNRDEVYGCGLNNRGQLGTSCSSLYQSENNEPIAVANPIKIRTLSKKPLSFNENQASNIKVSVSAKKSKSGFIVGQRSSYHVGITLSQQSKLFTEKSEGTGSQFYLNTINLNTEQKQFRQCQNLQEYTTLLDENEFISNIEGGPYHTIVQSNKGRVFYSGNIYKKSSIINDELTLQFSQLNLKKIGKVQKIKSGLTSIGLLNTEGFLFLLGALSENIICDEPYNIGINNIIDFGISKDKVYVATSTGEIYALVGNKKCLKHYKIELGQNELLSKIVEVHCGLEYCLFVSGKGQVYGEGIKQLYISCEQIKFQTQLKQNDSTSILTPQKIPNSSNNRAQTYTEKIYKVHLNSLHLTKIKPGLTHMICLCIKQQQPKQAEHSKQNIKTDGNKKKIDENTNTQNLVKKVQELEKQNKMLKQLIRDQGIQIKTSRNVGSSRKRDLSNSTNLTSKKGNNENNINTNNNNNHKFDININISEKVITKARKFDSSMEIPFEEITLGKQISQGGYGIIYKALWRKTTVAVKIFKIQANSQNSIRDFVSECHAMEALRHPNIVMFLGACTKPPNFAIVLEYCQGGTLWSILQRNGEINWEQRRKFALDTARGMNYLHERPTPILHRDLKSLNLLLDSNKRIKLADFGWTKGLQNYMTGKIGTYQWMAPQVVSSYQYTEKADVFSFGIILWQIASRQAPYRNIPGVQVAQDVLHKDLRPLIPKKTPESFVSLMKKCWVKNPENRPSFAQVIDQLQTMQLPN